MIRSQKQLEYILDMLKESITFAFVPKFTRCIVFYIGNCVDRFVRHQKEVITKRLQKRRQRLYEGCKYRSDRIKCKCDCKRCTKYRQIQRRNIVVADFMTNFVRNDQPTRTETLNTSTDTDQMSCTDKDRSCPWTLTQTRTPERRDVQELDRTSGWEWWMKMQQSAACMPSLQHDAAAPTKSVYSSAGSCSYFESCNTLTELNEESGENQTSSLINDRPVEKSSKLDRMTKHPRQPREGSKSDSKIQSGRDKTTRSRVFRSASTKSTCVRRSTNKGENLDLTKRRHRKRRPCKITRSSGVGCLDLSA